MNLTPHYARIKVHRHTHAAKKAVEAGQKKWIQEENKMFYNIRDNLNVYLYTLHRELTFKLHNLEFSILEDQIRLEISKLMFDKRATHEKKLINLLNEASGNPLVVDNIPDTEFFPRILNLSDCLLTPSESELLVKGIKYCPPQHLTKHNIQNMVIDIEASTSNQDTELKYKCIDIIKKRSTFEPKANNYEFNILKDFKKKCNEEGVVITKADKNNAVVLMPSDTYDMKMTTFINDTKCTQQKRDPTNKYQEVVKNAVKFSCMLSEKEKKFLINKNPTAPYIYGLAKVHKPHIPIRPVVSYRTAPAYRLARKSNDIYRHLTQFSTPFSVTNSKEVLDKIKSIPVPENAKLVSFDVVNLFPSIPVP
ncbi:uncharacterized protein LOC103521245, partial [Diaphorina citri]|uniref:Uncharacterized protein LOC103521245 n=1 Tax=Diaphorina citri TaxID=121845 RepID=A0A1S3DM09_DIACI